MQTVNNLDKALLAAHSASSADNSQPWAFEIDGELVRVCAVPADTPGPFGANSPATLLAIGGVIENLSAASAHYGLELRERSIDADEQARGVHFAATIVADDAGHTPATACPVVARHTNRFAYRSDPLDEGDLAPLDQAHEGLARLKTFSGNNALADIARAVAAASRIRFQTREIHEWLARSLRYSNEEIVRGDGLDVHTLDLPPGGKAFLRFSREWNRMRWLNRLGVYRAMAAIEASRVARGPTVVALIAPADRAGCIAAGRLMCRAWVALNAQGIAVHPYYVVSDQLQRLREGTVPEPLAHEAHALERTAPQLFGLNAGETLHMLLRVGYPTREPARSLRRPLTSVVRVLHPSRNPPD